MLGGFVFARSGASAVLLCCLVGIVLTGILALPWVSCLMISGDFSSVIEKYFTNPLTLLT
jgi:hypothetical protein